MASADHVLAEIARRCKAFGVRLIVDPARNIEKDGVMVGGYFCDQSRELAVAAGSDTPVWMGTLLHEYSHLTQWIENTPLWRAYDERMWDWLAGKAIRNPSAAVRSVQLVEEDCERRAIRLAQELEADIDLPNYVRAANAYIHFHNVLLDKRKWYRPGTVMAAIPSLMAAANPTLDTDFRTTPKALRLELEKLV